MNGHSLRAGFAALLILAVASTAAQGRQEGNPNYDQGYQDGYAEGSYDGYASGYSDAYQAGFDGGLRNGYHNGYANGSADGYAHGYSDAYADGYRDGLASSAEGAYQAGYAAGYENGSAAGYAGGYEAGHAVGFAQGFEGGFNQGYAQGLQNGTGDPAPDFAPRWPHPAAACSEPYHVQWAGWDLCWQQEDLRAQGLEINRAFFHNASVAWKMGVPFSLTKYESPLGPGPFKDVLGRPGDADLFGYGRGALAIAPGACPRLHGDGQLLNGGRICLEHRQGPDPVVTLWARYDVFNYRFVQGWTFDSRGTVEPFLALGGLLIDGANAGSSGQDHYHHVYWRIDFDIASPGSDVFQAFKHGTDQAIPFNPPPNVEGALGTATGLLGAGDCGRVRGISATAWCDVRREALLGHTRQTIDKWRVADTADTNGRGQPRSFEFAIHSDAPIDRFSTFDVGVLQYRGDSAEVGYELPTNPTLGDSPFLTYLAPPDAILDPVAWMVHHTHHDTRDEDAGSMSLHSVGFDIRPRNFMDSNPGEDTYP